MQITYFFQNFNLDEKNKEFLENKIKKLEHFSDKIQEARVGLSYRLNRIKEQSVRLEINLKMPNKILRAEIKDKNLLTAVEDAIKKLESQLRRYRIFGEMKKKFSQKFLRKIKES